MAIEGFTKPEIITEVPETPGATNQASSFNPSEPSEGLILQPAAVATKTCILCSACSDVVLHTFSSPVVPDAARPRPFGMIEAIIP